MALSPARTGRSGTRPSGLGKVLFAVLAASLIAAVTSGASHAQPAVGANAVSPDMGIMATHKSPFNCGKRFYANNWSPGHNPSGSIDWQSYGGDSINGETVRATAGGRAYFYNAGSTSYGRWVEIRHGDGTRTRYAHLATQVRSPGSSMSVSRGTKIGTVGSTGGSTGPHLHYEQRFSSGAVDRSPTVDGVTVSLGSRRAITSSNNCGSNPYTPREVCGSSYSVINSHGLTGGRVYLLYNSSGYNCVVTLKSRNVGSPSRMSAFLEPRGSSRSTDSGNFSYYAGPVKRHAPGTCVRWGGSIGNSSYTSPFQHCG